MNKRILIIDDDPHIREVIEFTLQKADYTTVVASNGKEGLEAFEKQSADLIVLDVGMPELDGFETCRQLRRSSDVPILFLSAKDEEVDRIVGLEIGGDDYVTKPFSPRELVARVGVILKRVSQNNVVDVSDQMLIHGMLSLDTGRREVQVSGEVVEVTGTEFDILRVLMDRPGVVYNRDQILDRAWADNIHVSDRTIDSHVRNLRAKLRDAGCLNAIRTVHGIGFQLGHCEPENGKTV